jgi:hypothetical protein
MKKALPSIRLIAIFPVLLAGLILAGGCTGNNKGQQGMPGEIRGTVQLDPHVPLWMTHGTLTVVAMMKGPTSPDYLPVARAVFIHPTFPVPFVISQKDVRLTGINLEGSVRLVARLSLESGSSLVASGEYGAVSPVEGAVGGTPVSILISKELPSGQNRDH